MKRYYIEYWRDFENTYNLYWAETTEQIKKAESFCERISRKTAERLCAEENYRRKYDKAKSGFASNLIFPVDWDGCDWMNDKDLYRDGYIIFRDVGRLENNNKIKYLK